MRRGGSAAGAGGACVEDNACESRNEYRNTDTRKTHVSANIYTNTKTDMLSHQQNAHKVATTTQTSVLPRDYMHRWAQDSWGPAVWRCTVCAEEVRVAEVHLLAQRCIDKKPQGRGHRIRQDRH